MQIDPVDSKNNNYIIVGLQTKSFINKLLDFLDFQKINVNH